MSDSHTIMALLEQAELERLKLTLPGSLPLVRKVAADQSCQLFVRDSALLLLAGAEPAATVPILIRVLEEPGAWWQGRAVELLGRLGEVAAAALPRLVGLLSSEDPYLRGRAAEAISGMGPAAASAEQALVVALKDEEQHVRSCAAMALGNLASASPTAVSALTERLADEDPDVRNSAAQSLERLGHPASPEPSRTQRDAKRQPAITATRRFEFLAGSSAKFWEVRTAGREMTVRFGRIGTDGQAKRKAFPSDAAALAAARKLISEKTSKGYAEVTAAQDGSSWLTAEQWWQRLEQSGWCSEVPPDEVSRIRRALETHTRDLSKAFRCLAANAYDAECIESDDDYSKFVVPAYRKASFGAFTPSSVEDRVDFDEEVAEVSVQAGGRTFKKRFEQVDDYVADGFHEFMNSVVAKLGEERRFFILPAEGQVADLVFVTPATYKQAQRFGLIPEAADED